MAKSVAKRWTPDSGSARRGRAEPPDTYQQALGLLVRREHSRRELKRKLTGKGADPEQAERALDTLAEQNFQNDQRYALAFARTRAHAGYGPVRIRAELATHALASDEILAALEGCETDWTAAAADLVARRYRPDDLADPGKRRKVVEFLLRRGFGLDDAYAAIRAAVDAGSGDDSMS